MANIVIPGDETAFSVPNLLNNLVFNSVTFLSLSSNMLLMDITSWDFVDNFLINWGTSSSADAVCSTRCMGARPGETSSLNPRLRGGDLARGGDPDDVRLARIVLGAKECISRWLPPMGSREDRTYRVRGATASDVDIH